MPPFPSALAGALILALVVLRAPAGAQVASPEPSPPASGALPAPSPVASPGAPPSPGVSSSPTPPPTPLVLDRTRIGVIPGTTVAVHVGGGQGAVAVTSPFSPIVDVRYDPVARDLFVSGRAPGTVTVTVADAAGDTASLDVLVAPPAGIVPEDVEVDLGGLVSPAFAAAKIAETLTAQAQVRPGARITVKGATPLAPLRPGDRYDATATVHVDGANVSVDVDGTTIVHLRDESLARLDPQILFYSDDPERLLATENGVLFRGTLDAAKPARAYAYHVADRSVHDLSLVLRATDADARVEVLGAAAGPSDAFAYVGHRSTVRYFLERAAQESIVVPVTSDTPYVVRLGSRALDPGELVAGIYDVRVLDGGPVDLTIVATEPGGDPLAFAGTPEVASDGHGRRGEFDLTAVPPLALTYTAGAADPPPFDVGTPTIPNLRPGGRALGGDYGALRAVSLQIANSGTDPANVYFYEIPEGGSATTTMWFDGDPAPTEIPCVVRPNRYTIRTFALAPGETRDVTGAYMTDGTSSFPLAFGLTSVPPSPPPGPFSADACNPRPAPPSPAPSASPAT